MYRFLLSRRWLILTLVAVALIPTMIKLGFWQLHRHEHRVAGNQLIARNLSARPVPVERLSRPDAAVPLRLTWRTVTATGRYDPRREVVVRSRTSGDGQAVGYFVLTPLITARGDAVLVNRGWIRLGEDITAYPPVPKAPAGRVTITGRLRPDETTASSGIKDKGGMPPRQVMLISSRQRAKDIPRPLLGGYVELASTSPEPSGPQPDLVPEPDHNDIGPHLAYAIQWWMFTAMVPVGWVILARRERKDLLSAAGAASPGGGDAPAAAPAVAGGAVRGD